ncbi:glucuronate isomerase [Tuwongella immobilis]|uniref:Uncharacterized protein n=1 Tax=Tuwongella immobilis TaxID=692036 RepID=A0A6C2YMI3_9BACT|nr:glucuronate isomerase [Tuwongella immobilis]VIP02333.1 glucuronate isomerase : Uronate isomerase OS=uncultured Acidobacteria bacterium A2 PE=4 SV=1: UxaC [Tuwongella immobilis]VTS01085.1 glucuronate isomerase : Uronate isomerase OS=uncultured Acidobacteria bacterium A2 PE=4 SV=1: UxaC [Tuwongella immobilis]
MAADKLHGDLVAALTAIPLIDPHSHIDPYAPTSRTLDDILGYHYYTELAHSAGMSQAPLAADVPPVERVRAILGHIDRFNNTAQYRWLIDILQSFLGWESNHVSAADADALFAKSEAVFGQADWEQQVFEKTNLEKIFLTNEFDDSLEGFDTARYVPCLRTDGLVFQLNLPVIRERLAKRTGIQVGDAATLRAAIRKLFEHFVAHGARACAISLPPSFTPVHIPSAEIDRVLSGFEPNDADAAVRASAVFWTIAECCREFALPFDLMIGVNRRVYRNGVYQGQDLFDSRTSLVQYQELFNAFPDVVFPVSVLSSFQNQELVSHSWIFPNVITSGHWWYSNIPTYIASDLRARLQAVPKTKQIGYYSDAYKLEFVRPKFGMYRSVLAHVLADEFVRPGILSETQAVELGRQLLRENVRQIFKI